MKLEFEDYLSETDNIYDLVGNCFGLLCENIDNHQAFIGEYISIGNKIKEKERIILIMKNCKYFQIIS